MSGALALLVATSVVAGVVSILLRAVRPGAAIGAGMAGLALSAVVALGLPVGGASVLGDLWDATGYGRVVAVGWSVAGLLVVLTAVLAGRGGAVVATLPGAMLLGLGAAAGSLAARDAQAAVLLALAVGVAALLVSTRGPAAELAGTSAAARELRATVVGALAVLGGTVLLPVVAASGELTGLGESDGELAAAAGAAGIGAATLAVALGVAVRFGSVPFHVWAARVAAAAPGPALPFLLGWAPLALGAAALAVLDTEVVPLVAPLVGERAIVAGVAVLTLVAGPVAAWIQDDLDHLAGYVTIANGGPLLLGLAALDADAWPGARAWLVVLAVATSALGAWVTLVDGRFGSRRLPELEGWVRRTPLGAAALVLAALAMVGLPGWPAWEARRGLAELALGGPLGTMAWLAGLAVLVPLGRAFAIGLRAPAPGVAGAPGDRPRLAALGVARGPATEPRRDDIPGRTGARRASGVRAALSPALGPGLAALADNRHVLAALTAALTALVAVAMSAGALDLLAAAGAEPPIARELR